MIHLFPGTNAMDDCLSRSDESDEISDEERQLYNGIHADFDDLTSGYSTISSNKGEYAGIKKPSTTGAPQN